MVTITYGDGSSVVRARPAVRHAILWVSCGRHVWWSPWLAGSMAIDGGNLRPA